MNLRDSPSVLKRGAAPPGGRALLFFLAGSGLLHLAIVSSFLVRSKPPTEIALPSRGGGPRQKAQLVRITPLRTFPAPEAAAPEAARSRPKPALIKRYTPGAKVAVKAERGPARKSETEDAKTAAKAVAPAPQADRAPRWFSSDSTLSASVAVDGDFRFAFYLAALRNKIGSRWVPPPGLDARGRIIKATLYFRVHRDGQISLARIENASGFTFFDQTAMRALLAATPLPPLPQDFTDSYLGVHFGFEYQQ